jgi:PUA-domain protein
MKRAMNNKETKEFLEKVKSLFGLEFSKKDKIDKDENIILVNNEPLFFYHDNMLMPSLKQLLKNNFLKKITVDMGAVKFVVSGADIMRPGITRIDEGIQKNEIISVIDMNHSKPLAIGIALFSGDDIQKMTSGKVIKNLHWVGDKFWSNY